MTTELPEGFDPDTFLDALVFTDEPVTDDLPRLTPGEKVPVRRELAMNWDGQTDQRIRAIAQARGMSLEDLLEEWAELEIARLDALHALEESRRHDDGRHSGTAA